MKIILKKIQSLFHYSLIYYFAALLLLSFFIDEKKNYQKQEDYWHGIYMINPEENNNYILWQNRKNKVDRIKETRNSPKK